MTDEPEHTFASVWDALEATPEDTADMRLRSGLAITLRSKVGGWETTPAQSARRRGVAQPRLRNLLRGRTDRFSLSILTEMANHARRSDIEAEIR